jgi:hypothetical protein
VIVLSIVTNATIKTLGGEERLLTISLLMEAVIDRPDQIATVSMQTIRSSSLKLRSACRDVY